MSETAKFRLSKDGEVVGELDLTPIPPKTIKTSNWWDVLWFIFCVVITLLAIFIVLSLL